MTDFTLRPLTVPERKYTYAQSSQLQGQTGNIGYLRGDFGSSGNQFYTTWFDTRPQWKSDEFKRDLDDVINALRSEEYGLASKPFSDWCVMGVRTRKAKCRVLIH